jgi:hypothetical protein
MANEDSAFSALGLVRTHDRTPSEGRPLRGLMVREPWANLILSGKKTWEIRGTRTGIRGLIYIIPSGSGRIAGRCEIVDCVGPVSIDELIANSSAHLTPPDELRLLGLPYKRTFAWVLANPRRFDDPIPYTHPSGAITWVDLEKLKEELPCPRDSVWHLTRPSARS